jgi:hypothetical protein
MLLHQQQTLLGPALSAMSQPALDADEIAVKFGCRSCDTLKRQLEEAEKRVEVLTSQLMALKEEMKGKPYLSNPHSMTTSSSSSTHISRAPYSSHETVREQHPPLQYRTLQDIDDSCEVDEINCSMADDNVEGNHIDASDNGQLSRYHLSGLLGDHLELPLTGQGEVEIKAMDNEDGSNERVTDEVTESDRIPQNQQIQDMAPIETQNKKRRRGAWPTKNHVTAAERMSTRGRVSELDVTDGQ